ncbi:MAG: multifunctional CCA addition/repair protein [Gammaproteobacteria bacterium]|nr:multifunctional CCA addition/repair protein [Gammaproteobacteria bacterium]
MKTYKVGGAVRDRLLGRAVADVDWVVVGATPEELIALGYKPVGRDFPVFLHPRTGEEHALARTERKIGRGHTGFSFDTAARVTLEDDLRRRDLTINAMAETEDGKLIDPHGGKRDLDTGVLRHVSPAFVEDPLRVLRVARFAARLGFTVAEETLALMRGISASGELGTLSPERIWSELERALGEQAPRRFVEVLRECGALAAVLPEIDCLFGVPQPERHHPEVDTGVHVLLALDQAARLSPDARVRFAVLVHDLGKGLTARDAWPRHVGHEDAGARMVETLCARLRAPRDFRELALLAARFHGHCHRAAELRPGTVVELIERTDALRRPERFELFLLACEADARGRAGRAERPYPQAGRLRLARDAAAAVAAADLVAAGVTGAALGDKLRQRRIAAVAAVLAPPS